MKAKMVLIIIAAMSLTAAEIYNPRSGKEYDDAAALKSLKTHIEYVIKQTDADIEGIEFYELYNEPSKDVVESNFGFMSDPTTTRKQMLIAAFYAKGILSDEEKASLISAGLFTQKELEDR